MLFRSAPRPAALGLTAATYAASPIGLYATLGIMVVGASIGMSYHVHSMFLPNWFVRRRDRHLAVAPIADRGRRLALRLHRVCRDFGYHRGPVECRVAAPGPVRSRSPAGWTSHRRWVRENAQHSRCDRRPRLGRASLDASKRVPHASVLVDRIGIFYGVVRVVFGPGAPD